MKLLNCLNYFESIWCIMRVQTKIWVYLGFHDTLLLIFKFVHVAQGVFPFIFFFSIHLPINLSKEMCWHIIRKDTYLCKDSYYNDHFMHLRTIRNTKSIIHFYQHIENKITLISYYNICTPILPQSIFRTIYNLW